MKNYYFYVVLILILISCEIFTFLKSGPAFKSINTFIFRELVCVVLVVWYYHQQGSNLNSVQKRFLISLLIPLLLGVSKFIAPNLYVIIINSILYSVIYALWISILNSLGAEIKLSKLPPIYYLLIPVIFVVPFLYIFLVLLPMLGGQNIVLTIIFALFASTACVYVLFLPSTSNFSSRYLIILGIWLFEFMNMMQGFFIYNSQSFLIYPFTRILQTSAYIILILGMTSYYKPHSRIIIEN